MDELIVGTYEGFVLGYSIRTEDAVSTLLSYITWCNFGKITAKSHFFAYVLQVMKLKQTFATHSHTASVRCMSIGGKFLASGGTDDKVVVIDMKTRKEHTVLMNHDGTINTVAFTNGGTHLLTGSDDGSIIVTRTGNWQIEKIWKKAHGGM